MTDPQTPSAPHSLDPEAIATAQLVLPLVLARMEAEPVWSLAMLDAVRAQLSGASNANGGTSGSGTNVQGFDALFALSAGEALALSHAQAVKDELVSATILAELALRNPKDLGTSVTNARLLLASLFERQGRLVEAAQIVAKACSEAPADENAKADRERIVGALRQKAHDLPPHQKAEQVSMLAQVVSSSGWNFGDAKSVVLASLSLLRAR